MKKTTLWLFEFGSSSRTLLTLLTHCIWFPLWLNRNVIKFCFLFFCGLPTHSDMSHDIEEIVSQPKSCTFHQLLNDLAGRGFNPQRFYFQGLLSLLLDVKMFSEVLVSPFFFSLCSYIPLWWPPLFFASPSVMPPLKGLMESWSNVSGNCCYNRRNSRRCDSAVHRSSPLLL